MYNQSDDMRIGNEVTSTMISTASPQNHVAQNRQFSADSTSSHDFAKSPVYGSIIWEPTILGRKIERQDIGQSNNMITKSGYRKKCQIFNRLRPTKGMIGGPNNAVLGYYKKIEEICERLIVAEEIKTQSGDNAFRYLVFSTPLDFAQFYETQKSFNTHYHEVILGDLGQKFKMDIETEDPSMTEDEMLRHLGQIDKAIIEGIAALFPGEKRVRTTDILTTDSTRIKTGGVKKFSYHKVVVTMAFYNIFDIRAIFEKVYEALPANTRKLVDTCVYSDIQNFRIMGSSKLDDNTQKMPARFNKCRHTSILDSLITNTAGCRFVGKNADERTKVFAKKAKKMEMAAVASADVDKAIELAGSCLNGHMFMGSVDGNQVRFKRVEPTYCELCNREHTRDNTAYMLLLPNKTTGKMDVKLKCFKAKGQSIDIGSFDSVEAIKSASGKSRAKKAKLDEQTKYNNSMKYINNAINTIRKDKSCQSIFDYAKNNTERVNCYNKAEMANFELAETLFVKANMKMGKTNALQKYLREHFLAKEEQNEIMPQKIIFISFRQTFSSNIKERFGQYGFMAYNDIKDKKIEHPKVIIQVESLHRLNMEQFCPADLVVLDESESILGQFSSGLGRSTNLSWLNFTRLMAQSRHVIAMDAFLSDKSFNVINLLRGNADVIKAPKDSESSWANVRPGSCNLHFNEHKNAEDYTYYLTNNKAEWMIQLRCDLEKGKRIVVPTSSLTEAKMVKEYIAREGLDISIGMYSSKTEKSQKDIHFGDVNKFWSQYDVLIYTPTVSAGVSFEVCHYDVMYAWFVDSSCDVRTCIQMMGRIRNIADKRVVIGFQCCPRSLLDKHMAIIDSMNRQREDLFGGKADAENDSLLEPRLNDKNRLEYVDNAYFRLFVENMVTRNRSRNYFLGELIGLLRQTGANMKSLAAMSTGKERQEMATSIKDIRRDNEMDEAEDVANAPEMSRKWYDQIRQKLDNEESITPAEDLALAKFRVRQKFNWDQEIYAEDYIELKKPELARQYKNCRKILYDDDIQNAVEHIRQEELKMYEENKIKLRENKTALGGIIKDTKACYEYSSHAIAANILTEVGLRNITDVNTPIKGQVFIDKFADNDSFWGKLNDFCEYNEKRKVPKSMLSSNNYPGQDALITGILRQVNKVLKAMYGIYIKRGPKQEAYKFTCANYYLVLNPRFEFDVSKLGSHDRPHIYSPSLSIFLGENDDGSPNGGGNGFEEGLIDLSQFEVDPFNHSSDEESIGSIE